MLVAVDPGDMQPGLPADTFSAPPPPPARRSAGSRSTPARTECRTPAINLGQRLRQVLFENPGSTRVEVVLGIQHRPPVDPPQATESHHAGQRRQAQARADGRRCRLQPRRQQLGAGHPPLVPHHRMEVTALDQVVGQRSARRTSHAAPRGRSALGLQLHQCLTQGDARGVEHLAELALGRQLAARRQQAVFDLLLQGMADGCYRSRWRRASRLPIWTRPAPEQGMENSASLVTADEHPVTKRFPGTARIGPARVNQGFTWSTLGSLRALAGPSLHQTVTQAAYLGSRFADLDQRCQAPLSHNNDRKGTHPRSFG
jgi:hypothetical protein